MATADAKGLNMEMLDRSPLLMTAQGSSSR